MSDHESNHDAVVAHGESRLERARRRKNALVSGDRDGRAWFTRTKRPSRRMYLGGDDTSWVWHDRPVNYVAPALPAPMDEARKNARNCGFLQLFMAGLNAVNALAIFTTFMRIGRSPALSQLDIDPSQVAEWRMQFLYVALPYTIVMGAWAGLNHLLLGKRSKLAVYSSIAYAVASLATCFSFIMVGGVFFLLFRKEMKGYFDAPAS